MALSLSIPGGAVQLSGNPIWCKVSGASAPAGSRNYELLLKITSTDGVLKGGPFIDSIAPDANGEALFDISGYVNQPMPVNFEWPMVGAVKAYIDAAYNISVIFGEYYIDSNDVPQTTWAHSDYSQNVQIIKGVLPDIEVAEYNDAETTFFEEWIEKGRFLTRQPDNMRVSPAQPVKLFLMSPYANNQDVIFYITAKYADDPDGELTEYFTHNSELFRDGLFEFNASPAHNGIPSVKEGKQMVSFQVGFVNLADPGFGAVDLRNYLVDHSYHEHNNYLFSANSLGGMDVLYLTGEVKISTEIAGTEGYKPLPQGASARTHTVVTTSRSGRRKYTVNSGYKSKAEILGFEDVYLSRALWLLYNGMLIPVTLTNKDYLLYDSMEDVDSVELELMEGHNRKFA